MTDDEFEAFLSSARDELQRKQDALSAAYNLGELGSFWFDQASGRLEFRDRNGEVEVTAGVVPVGSYAPAAETWVWAWANESLLPELRRRAESLRELANVTGLSLFEQGSAHVTQEMPWELTAMAVRHLHAVGAYRAPGKRSDLYLAMVAVNRVQAS